MGRSGRRKKDRNVRSNSALGLLSTVQINRALIKPLRASDRNQLVAVANRSMEQAEAYAREWDIPRAHGSCESLLEDPKVDVIYIQSIAKPYARGMDDQSFTRW